MPVANQKREEENVEDEEKGQNKAVKENEEEA